MSDFFELRWLLKPGAPNPVLQYRQGLIGKWTDVPTVWETKTR